MDVDTNWCLECSTQLDGPWPYCSSICKERAHHLRLSVMPSTSSTLLRPSNVQLVSPSDSLDEDDDDEAIYHDILEVDPPHARSASASSAAYDHERIHAWRINVSPSQAMPSTPRAFRPPKLLALNQQRSPTLCVSKPQPHAEASSQNSPSPPHASFLSAISTRLFRIGCPPVAPVMISPSASTDSFATPVPSTACSSPLDEKLPADIWFSTKRDIEPPMASSMARSIDIKRKPLVECTPAQGRIYGAPTPPQPLVRLRDDHPLKARGRTRRPHARHASS